LTINITSVPEPSTWAMMLLGFAGLGFAGYRTSRGAVSVACNKTDAERTTQTATDR
jgi:hypothetical protein